MDDTDDMKINSVCFSPDGKLLATVAKDNMIRVRSRFCTFMITIPTVILEFKCSTYHDFLVL